MSADPTTLLGTLASLAIKQQDQVELLKQEQEEDREKKKYEKSKILEGGYTDFTDWNRVERPRTSNFGYGSEGNKYVSALAISGDDFLKYQSRLNPNRRFTGPLVKPEN